MSGATKAYAINMEILYAKLHELTLGVQPTLPSFNN
jgi:hypothetical protein